MHDDETARPGSMTTRQMVIAFAIIEASGLGIVMIYMLMNR